MAENKTHLKIGIIGCGQIAKIRHVPELAQNGLAELAGFYDYMPEHAEVLAEQYGGKVYGRYEEMLDDESIDGVVICTSNDSHASISIEALNRGKYVLCEKPMCMNLEEAVLIEEADKKSSAFYMAAHNQRFNLAHRKAREVLRSGQMGRVISFRCCLAHTGPEHFSVNRSTSTWYLNKRNSGFGCITDLGIHKCDVLSYLLEEPFVRVGAIAGTRDKKDSQGNFVDVYDNAVCILESASGIMGTLNLSYSNYGPMENGAVLFCEKGVLRVQYDPECALEVIMDSGEKICYINEEHPSSGVTDAFVRAIIENKKSPVPAEESGRGMKVVAAIEESARTGRFVEIK